ncbi:TIGR04086 family membrane protein [Thalassorhabdus alkalitolerans]|uniref:TIGR04086 family membrane protein n=1 Tax=Thalassorhabdus alkalitolerans TaxID=2282697 RepID=A0ABW0YQA6_9BACI
MAEQQRLMTAVFYGTGTIIALVFLFSFVLSLILRFTSFSEQSLTWLVVTLSIGAMLAGGITAGVRSSSRGWLTGFLAALLFVCLAFLVQFLGFDNAFTGHQMLMHALFLGIATLGGMIGVNLSSN